MRKSEITRKTKETDIKLSLEILPPNTPGSFSGSSNIGFFDHMLSAFAVHGGFNICLEMTGDIEVDCHHSIEDVGIVLGKAFCEALGDKCGITRFSDLHIPMDEALCFAAADISGRAYLVFDCAFVSPMIGTYDTQMTQEFFRAFAYNAGITLHLRKLYGVNDHHVTEALYKAAARAIGKAAEKVGDKMYSSKGVL